MTDPTIGDEHVDVVGDETLVGYVSRPNVEILVRVTDRDACRPGPIHDVAGSAVRALFELEAAREYLSESPPALREGSERLAMGGGD